MRNEALTRVGECLCMETKQFSEAKISYTNLYLGWTQFDPDLFKKLLSPSRQIQREYLDKAITSSFKILSNLLMIPHSTLCIMQTSDGVLQQMS